MGRAYGPKAEREFSGIARDVRRVCSVRAPRAARKVGTK